MSLFDKRCVTNCIELKVMESDKNEARFHNNYINYPLHCITGTDLSEVSYNFILEIIFPFD